MIDFSFIFTLHLIWFNLSLYPLQLAFDWSLTHIETWSKLHGLTSFKHNFNLSASTFKHSHSSSSSRRYDFSQTSILAEAHSIHSQLTTSFSCTRTQSYTYPSQIHTCYGVSFTIYSINSYSHIQSGTYIDTVFKYNFLFTVNILQTLDLPYLSTWFDFTMFGHPQPWPPTPTLTLTLLLLPQCP